MHSAILGHTDIAIVELSWETPYKGYSAAHLLRGAIAQKFPDNPLFHQHQDNKNIYRYPLIQYRWDKGKGIIAGINDGGKQLLKVSLTGESLYIGEKKLQIAESCVDISRFEVSVMPTLQRYYFKSPWLPFKQDNYQKYRAMTSQQQIIERDRLLIANLLATMSALGIYLPCRLYASFFIKKIVPCNYKDKQLMGFIGEFVANINIPCNIAIGKAVSHGYGWINRQA